MKTLRLLTVLLAAAALGCSSSPTIDENGYLTNSLGMKFKLIKAGTFTMGYSGPDAYETERPPHQVTLSRDFLIGVHEVTQGQYDALMDSDPSKHVGLNLPVDNIRRDLAVEFCRKLSEKEGATYRLPTDAEWEYACRAGTSTQYWWGDNWEDGKAYVWYAANSDSTTHPVGSKEPNPWGLYDMPGNVGEFVSDPFGYHWPQTQVDPTGPQQPQPGLDCTLRGVSWNTEEEYMPIAMRPSFRYGAPSQAARFPEDIGFRVVREVTPADFGD